MSRRKHKKHRPLVRMGNQNIQHKHQAQGVMIEHRGPLPLPHIAAGWNDIVPGAAERIIAMAEQEQKHRHESEAKLIDANVQSEMANQAERKRGQWMALVVTMAALSITAILGIYGHAVAAGVVGGSTIVGLASVFITGRVVGQLKTQVK